MSAPVAPSVRGLSRWVTRPSAVAAASGALLGLTYGFLTIDFPREELGLFAAIASAVVAFALAFGRSFSSRGLRTLKEVGAGLLPASRANLMAAVREVRGAPDRSFWLVMGSWAGSATLLGLAFALFADVPWIIAPKVAFIGVLFGPISASLSHLLTLFRSRAAVERLAAAGLTAAEVAQASPPTRAQLQRRLVIFLAIAVLTPAAMAADLSIATTNYALDAMLAAQGHAAQVEAMAQATRADLLALGILAALVISLTIVEAVLAARALSEPMQRMREEAARVASGELRELSVIPCEDEVWAAAASFSGMQTQLRSVLDRLKQAGSKLSTGSEQLVTSTTANEEGAAEQAASLNETSATTEELARSARQIAENAAAVAQIAQRTYDAAQHGQRSSDSFQQSMAKMRSGNQAIADSVVKLNKRVQQIGKIVEFINEIADKSDLLALNAELEGNKAGEVGRGFSLVAAEMRRLAENVLTSTREIERLIHEVRDATNAAVMATEAGVKATDAGARLATAVSANLALILELARQTSDSVRAISLATQQQQTGTDQLAIAMADILRVTEQSAQTSRQMADANQDLSSLSTELSKVVERFKVA